MTDRPMLFSPLTLRSVTLKNRIVLSPLCMYSATDGLASDWHLSHLAQFARGGVGLVFTEATAVEPRGRISPGCCGIWSDAHAEAYRPVVRAILEEGAVPAIQIAHAGRKASALPPWLGGAPLVDADRARGMEPWQTVGPTAEPVGANWPSPHPLSTAEIAGIVEAFGAAARRAVRAGFRVLEIHGAHGYLMHSFLSPLANKRNDAYGGDRKGRMRFALEIVEAVRAAWPDELPLFCRISSVDGPPEGWSIEDSVALARELKAKGVDVVDCSAGGISGPPLYRADERGKPLEAKADRAPGFQVPYAERIRKESGIKTMAVGVIVEARQAEEIVSSGRADLTALGRELMYNPFWAHHAAMELGAGPQCALWPRQYGWAMKRRAALAAARAR